MCARGVWGQQLWHERSSGLFYCHLKTTFKTRLSLPKKKKKKKTIKETGPFNSSAGPVSRHPGCWPGLRCHPRANTRLQGTSVGVACLRSPAPPPPENRQPDLERHFILVGVWRATIKCLFRAIRGPEGAVIGVPTLRSFLSLVSGQLPLCRFSPWVKQVFGRLGQGWGLRAPQVGSAEPPAAAGTQVQ